MTALEESLELERQFAEPAVEPPPERRREEPPVARLRVDPRWLIRWAAGLLIAFIVGFILFVPTISGLTQQRTQTLLEKHLRSDLLNGLVPVNGPIASGTTIGLLEIPEIGVRQVLVEGTRSEDLVDGPGHLSGSVLPGQSGVSAILGRRLAAGASFRDLEKLLPGDEVTVTTGQGVHTYEVIDSTVRESADAAAFLGEGNMLLLITGGSGPVPDSRLVVRAVLTSQPQARGAALSTGPARLDELGLEGDNGASGPLLGWMQLLAVCAVAGVLLARRLGGRVAWVLAAPPLALLCVLVWENLLLLFPAMS